MAPHVLLALLASAAASAAAQDVSDCTWQPEAEDTAELECRLKTLQTGPAVIPQVRSSATIEPLSATNTRHSTYHCHPFSDNTEHTHATSLHLA